MGDGQEWLDTLERRRELKDGELEALKRGNAIKLLGLDDGV
jgi:hypothetical protein